MFTQLFMSVGDSLQSTNLNAGKTPGAANTANAGTDFPEVNTSDTDTRGIPPKTDKDPSMSATELTERRVAVFKADASATMLANALNDAAEQSSPKGFLEWILSFFRSASPSQSVKFLQKNHSLISDAVNDVCQHMAQLDPKTVEDCIEALENSISQCKSKLSPEVARAYENTIAKMKGAQSFLEELQPSPAGQLLLEKNPEIVEAILRNGGPGPMLLQNFTDRQGINISRADPDQKCDEFLQDVTEDLFSEEPFDPGNPNGPTKQDKAIGKLFEGNNRLHLFIKDGCCRGQMPNISLPGGFEVTANREKYPTKFAAPETRKEYAKYLLGQFKKAYGNRALDAFRAYMKGFGGTGNSVACFGNLPLSYFKSGDFNFADFVTVIANAAMREAERSPVFNVRMTMDENFNITYEIVFNMSTELCKEEIESLVNKGQLQLPPGYDKDTFAAAAVIKAYVPVNDQGKQSENQQTEMFVAISYGDRSKLPAEA